MFVLSVHSVCFTFKNNLNREVAKSAKGYGVFVDWVYNQQNIPCLRQVKVKLPARP